MARAARELAAAGRLDIDVVVECCFQYRLADLCFDFYGLTVAAVDEGTAASANWRLALCCIVKRCAGACVRPRAASVRSALAATRMTLWCGLTRCSALVGGRVAAIRSVPNRRHKCFVVSIFGVRT